MTNVKKLVGDGWKFVYSKSTGFVSATHPKGGAFSVCELRLSAHVDMHSVNRVLTLKTTKEEDREIPP